MWREEVQPISVCVCVCVDSSSATPARPGSAPRPLPVLSSGSSDRRPRPGHGMTIGSQSSLRSMSPCPLPPLALCARPLPRRWWRTSRARATGDLGPGHAEAGRGLSQQRHPGPCHPSGEGRGGYVREARAAQGGGSASPPPPSRPLRAFLFAVTVGARPELVPS